MWMMTSIIKRNPAIRINTGKDRPGPPLMDIWGSCIVTVYVSDLDCEHGYVRRGTMLLFLSTCMLRTKKKTRKLHGSVMDIKCQDKMLLLGTIDASGS